ncbi:hypothetical protein PYW08_003617 [Mythimna loreyi]|uniref:Uncharacterized protein n=1 Tax=Mythimna loreyi TaxID=667449 RepID=A0ACC2QT61_9NEOP|nr:hypothetical protein PYW08_003617 [Mythimna loreyi]
MAYDFDFNFKVPKVLKSVKYSLAAVNGVFLLTGFLFLIVGITVLVTFKEYDALLTKRFFNVTGLVLATAVIILLGSGLGAYSAITKEFYFVAGYVALLLVTLILEISIMIAAFSLRNDATEELRQPMSQTLQQYFNRVEISQMWDDLQREFECCGIVGRDDWRPNLLPISCCFINIGTISPFQCTASNSYGVGCAALLGATLSYSAHVIAICAVVATCLQVLMSLMAGYLAYRSKFEVVELDS